MVAKKAAPGKVKSFNVKSQIKASDKEKRGVTAYAGEKPPPGAYVFSLKRIWMETRKDQGTNEDITVFAYLAEINDPRPAKKEFNGYAVWGRQAITDKGMGFVNQFLRVLDDGKGEALDQFYETGNIKARPDEKGYAQLLKIGEYKVGSPNLGDVQFVGVCADNAYTDKKTKKRVVNLQINSYIPLSEAEIGGAVAKDEDPDDDDDDVEYEEDDADEDESDEDEADDSEDDEDDEDEDDEEDGDYEEDENLFEDDDEDED